MHKKVQLAVEHDLGVITITEHHKQLDQLRDDLRKLAAECFLMFGTSWNVEMPTDHRRVAEACQALPAHTHL